MAQGDTLRILPSLVLFVLSALSTVLTGLMLASSEFPNLFPQKNVMLLQQVLMVPLLLLPPVMLLLVII